MKRMILILLLLANLLLTGAFIAWHHGEYGDKSAQEINFIDEVKI